MAKKAIPVRHRARKNSIAAKRSKQGKARKRPLSQTLQRAMSDPSSVSHDEMLELQSTVGSSVMRKALSNPPNSDDVNTNTKEKRPLSASTPFSHQPLISQQSAIQRKNSSEEQISHSPETSQTVPQIAPKALSLSYRASEPVTVQRKEKAGLEYTEEGYKNEFLHLDSTKVKTTGFLSQQKGMEDYYYGNFTLGDHGVAVFVIPEIDRGAYQIFNGATNTDRKLLQSGNVKLENDVHTAEWIIEGHREGGITAEDMMSGVRSIFNMRRQLKAIIHQANNSVDGEARVILTPTTNVSGNLGTAKELQKKKKEEPSLKKEESFDPMAAMDELFGGDDVGGLMGIGSGMDMFSGTSDTESSSSSLGVSIQDKDLLFEYKKMAPKSNGTAQVTMLYKSGEHLKRINEMNAMKFITGDRIKLGNVGKDNNKDTELERAYLKGDGKVDKQKWNLFKGGSYTDQVESGASKLRKQLVKDSSDIYVNGTTYLTDEAMGTLKLMVLNDAIASTISRFDAITGQSHQKNLLSFLPKAKRYTYTHALAGRLIPNEAMGEIWAELTKSMGKMEDLLIANLDVAAISGFNLREIQSELTTDQQVALLQYNRKTLVGESVTEEETSAMKEMILGKHNAQLHFRLLEVIGAYTETSDSGDMHTVPKGGDEERSTVVRSIEFANVGINDFGGVYETRHEVRFNEDDMSAIDKAIQDFIQPEKKG